MTVYLDRLLDERTSLTGVMTGLRDRAAAEERDITDGERSEITRLQERCVEIDGLLTEHQTQAESARAFADLQRRIDETRDRAGGDVERTTRTRQETSSPGRAFVESEQFRAYPGYGSLGPVRDRRVPRGTRPDHHRQPGHCPLPVDPGRAAVPAHADEPGQPRHGLVRGGVVGGDRPGPDRRRRG